jgi:SAM-dependent methyltransferase
MIFDRLRDLATHAGYRRYVKRKLGRAAGYRFDQWVRVVNIDDWKRFLAALPVASLDAREISPGEVSYWRDSGFASYKSVQFPEFDITREALPEKFDVIFAEHVFEHLRDPYAAARNVLSMLSERGVFMIATPFLIRVHGYPDDFTRWTPNGLRVFLQTCGFTAEVKSWGNRKAACANLSEWRAYGWWRSLRNEPDFPIVVWAYARKADGNQPPS